MKLIVRNNVTKILEASPAVKASVDRVLSFMSEGVWFNPAFKNGYWDGKVRFFDRSTNTFPTGLLDRVLELLEDGFSRDEYEVKDERTGKEFALDLKETSEIALLGAASGRKNLRDYQVGAVNSLRKSSLEGLKWQRGVLNLATNAGKTIIAEAIIQETYPKLLEKYSPEEGVEVDPVFLFVTHSKEIAFQAKKSFEENLGIDVGLIGDGKWEVKPVTIGIVGTMYSRYKKKKPEFEDLKNRVVGFIGDEIHHSSSTSYYDILASFKNAYLRIGLTGTVEKDEVKKNRLFALTGKVLSKISNEYLIKNGYSAKPEVFLVPISYPNVDDIRIYGNKENSLTYNDVYLKGIVSNAWRNFIIAKICEKEVKENSGQVLILVDRLEHGQAISDIFEYLGSSVRYQFLYGELDAETRQAGLSDLVNRKVDVIIATTILDEGVDVPNVNALIYARGGKSIRKLLQGIGRGLRKKEDGSSLRIYDFIDSTAYVLAKQSLSRAETVKKERFYMKKLKLSTLGITKSDFIEVKKNLDTTYDEKYQKKED